MSLFLRKNGFDLLEKDFDTLFSFKNVNGMLKTNVEEKENEYEFTVEVPGIEKKDINITLENGYLSIVATKNYSEEKNYIRKEIREGKYSRAFYIGNECDEENVKASLECTNNYVPYTVIGNIGMTGYSENTKNQIIYFRFFQKKAELGRN